MSWIRVYDSDRDNAIRNLLTVVGGSSIAYNAVLSVVKSDELEGAAAVTEPVTLADAKLWCKIDDDTTDDPLITALITAARQICEDYVNLSFIPRTVTARIINGLGGITLPYGPVNSITTVTDANSEDITTDFSLETPYGPITVIYEAGYTTLIQKFKNAILNQVAWMYQNRGDVAVAGVLSNMSKLILNQVRNV